MANQDRRELLVNAIKIGIAVVGGVGLTQGARIADEARQSQERSALTQRVMDSFKQRGITFRAYGPGTEVARAAEVLRSDSATFSGFPRRVEGVQVSTNTDFNADGIGAFVDKNGAALPSLSPISRGEVPVDSTGAMILPYNRMLKLETHDGRMMPDGKDRTVPEFFRVSPGDVLYISGGEFTLVQAHAATVGDLDMRFPQLDVRGDYPGVTNPQDHGIFIMAANDAETPEGGPVVSIEGAVPGHALVMRFKGATVNPRIAENQVYGFAQISGGNGVKDFTFVNLETGALGQYRADIGASLGLNVRRPLDRATMFRQNALVRNF